MASKHWMRALWPSWSHSAAWLISMVLLLGPEVCSKSTNSQVHYVPSDAKLGHIVTVFPTRQNCRIHDWSQSGNVHDYFRLLEREGSLISMGNLASLQETSIQLIVISDNSVEAEHQILQLTVGEQKPTLYFENAPYHGYILENEPVGTLVDGLGNFTESVRNFPDDCSVGFHSGDNMYFELRKSENKDVEMVSTTEFDREVTPFYQVVIDASCPDGSSAFARITVHVLDTNDNAPYFEKSKLHFSLLRKNLKDGAEVTQVKYGCFSFKPVCHFMFGLFGTE